MLAPEVTTGCRDGIGQAAGLKMKERLLLDRVNILRDYLVIHEAVKGAVPVFPYGTDATFPGRDEAAMAAQVALHLVPFSGLLEHCLFHRSIPCMKPDQQDSRFSLDLDIPSGE